MSSSQTLPRINSGVELSPAPPRPDGTPSWTLYHPVSDKHYRIDWAEFECLARFNDHDSKASLIKAVNDQTTLDIDDEDIDALIAFLDRNGLLELDTDRGTSKEASSKPIWKRVLHGYLYFSVPLIRPQDFLQRTLPYVRPLLSKPFIMTMIAILAIGTLLTLARLDEFMNSLPVLTSVQGVISGLVIFALLKILHEMAHAYTATLYGVRVPHMGVAFIILYPVLYTETSGAWRLRMRTQRFHIGVAGIIAELCVAALALIVWHAAPTGGLLQGLSLVIVAVSLVSSLLINLNPLMRFDGYYLLCDMTGEDNLQHRACAFARWTLRRILFADTDSAPESLSLKRQRFLTIFGFALLIYRFFLFMGIALLIYWMVPKPFGALLAAVELYWFIALPIWSELKIWWEKSGFYKHTRRTKITAATLATLVLLSIIPLPRTIIAPAVYHKAAHQSIYPPKASYIESLHVNNGDSVQKGEKMATLSSPLLQKDIAYHKAKLNALEQSQSGLSGITSGDKGRYNAVQADIALTRRILENLEKQADNLLITAPFDGDVRDLSPHIQAGRYVADNTFLFRIVEQDSAVITAYVDGNQLPRLTDNVRASFIPRYSPFKSINATITSIDETNSQSLAWPSLGSHYGGEIPTQQNDNGQALTIIQSRYAVKADPQIIDDTDSHGHADSVQSGHLHIKGSATSLMGDGLKRLYALIIREFGVN